MTVSATREGSMAIGVLSKPMQRVPEEEPAEPFAVPAREATSIGLSIKRRLWEGMLRECEAMVQHALSTGRSIPAEIMERLDQAFSAPDVPVTFATTERRGIDDASPGDTAAGSASAVEISRFASLFVAHAALTDAIAPATPEAVLLIAEERARHPFWSEFGPLPLVRQMLGLAIFSLALLLAVSLSPEVSPVNMSKSLMTLAGYPLLMIEIFLISAASLGACFANLQRINTVISDGTYDPRLQSTYWTRWVMGVISGVILSQLVYDFFLLQKPLTDPALDSVPPAIGEVILCLLGGYSVDFVHGTLKRAINTLGNFFGVTTDGGADNHQGAAMARTQVRAPDRPGPRPGREAGL
jgi:hypothetical protein